MENLSVQDWKEIVGTSASVWTILQMLSPVPTCYQFIRKRSVGDMIVTPYVVAFTSCTLWLFYGIIIDDQTVVKVNVIGSGLQFCYTLCYYAYSLKKGRVKKQLGLSLSIIFFAILYSFLERNTKRLILSFGLLCSGMTILFFMSPLANMHYVVKLWNSESLPRLLIASTFLVSIQWLLYGYITSDRCIMITNLLGTLLSGAQLILMLIIPREPKRKLTATV